MKKHWIKKQQEDADKVFAPQLDYDEENDILMITWLPQLEYRHSIETTNGFVFDISKKPEQDIKGVEIFDFMKKIKNERNKKH